MSLVRNVANVLIGNHHLKLIAPLAHVAGFDLLDFVDFPDAS